MSQSNNRTEIVNGTILGFVFLPMVIWLIFIFCFGGGCYE